MKTKHILPIFILFFYGCTEDIFDQTPNEVFVLKPEPNLLDSLKTYFPDFKDMYTTNPELFSDTVQKNIVLTNESEVYVTFLDEFSAKRNTLFWYSYNINGSTPSSTSDIIRNLLFPNILKKDDGGQLESGYTFQLGSTTFPPGTVIGFILIENGYRDDGSIDYNREMFYTDFHLNTNGKQQHILCKILNFNYLLIGFEDIDIDFDYSDKDYNEVIFAVTDNKKGYMPSNFDIGNVKIVKN